MSKRRCSECDQVFYKSTCTTQSFMYHVSACKRGRINNPFGLSNPSKRFAIILADPPWQYKSDKGLHGCAGDKYPTMALDDICRLPVGEALAAENCALLMWTTGPFLESAFKVISNWGFTYKTTMWVWVKRRRTGNVHCGMGRYTRSACEYCLLGVRGNVSRWRQSASISQLIEAESPAMPIVTDDPDATCIVDAEIREHSRKPDIVFDVISKFFPEELPRIELFSREPRPGWARWGNDIHRFD